MITAKRHLEIAELENKISDLSRQNKELENKTFSLIEQNKQNEKIFSDLQCFLMNEKMKSIGNEMHCKIKSEIEKCMKAEKNDDPNPDYVIKIPKELIPLITKKENLSEIKLDFMKINNLSVNEYIKEYTESKWDTAIKINFISYGFVFDKNKWDIILLFVHWYGGNLPSSGIKIIKSGIKNIDLVYYTIYIKISNEQTKIQNIAMQNADYKTMLDNFDLKGYNNAG